MPIRISRKHDDEAKSENSAPKLIFNWISFLGGVLGFGGITSLLFFFVMEVLEDDPSGAYVSVLYLPPIAIILLSIGLIIFGIRFEKGHRKKGKAPTISGKWQVTFNMSQFTHPKIVIIALTSTIVVTIIVMTLGAGSIGMLEYTESNAFCANTCHDVMGPEAAVYESSPHARIHCVECHVGHGPEGYIEAKLSGMRQLYGVAVGNYSRPIPTPIHNRRSSLEMCQSCHWPDRFIDYKMISRNYVHADEENTPSTIKLMVKVGGGGALNGNGLIKGNGIHYHMLSEVKVEFIARDKRRQDIPYVRVTKADGSVTEYNNNDTPLEDEEREALELHQIECLDCHSRPAHQFATPVESVNKAILAGLISRDLPYIKRQGVKVLAANYETKDEALEKIAEKVNGYYEEEYPEILTDKKTELNEGIKTLQDIYQNTMFPEMKARWSTHPDNIGHRDFPGCFRCHNDEMESDEGDMIFTDCTKCHLVLGQGEGIVEARSNFDTGQVFVHLDDDEEFDEYTLCTDCHDGGFGAYED